ncbi:unnamed protein product [Microthlaspi erraticum]|uniref:Uncharacterized protein n=1 Tax=Microthlaspi erraticum TaxID=1685480 RepID=A0A6D2JGX0_9BRAS|nr:unnamed protein product [Microthlaspi erraticum]
MESESAKVIEGRSKVSMLLNALVFTMCVSIYSEGFATSVEMRLALTDLYKANETVIFVNTFQNRFCVGEIFHVSTFIGYYFIPADLTRVAVIADGVSIAVGSTVLVVLAAFLDAGLAYYVTFLFSIAVGVYGIIFTYGRLDDIQCADDAKTKPADKAPTINSDAASLMDVELVDMSRGVDEYCRPILTTRYWVAFKINITRSMEWKTRTVSDGGAYFLTFCFYFYFIVLFVSSSSSSRSITTVVLF